MSSGNYEKHWVEAFDGEADFGKRSRWINYREVLFSDELRYESPHFGNSNLIHSIRIETPGKMPP